MISIYLQLRISSIFLRHSSA